MSAVVAWAEVTDGRVKKPTLEALTLGCQWADLLGLPLWASVVGEAPSDSLKAIFSEYGAEHLVQVQGAGLETFRANAYARALASLVRERQIQYVVLPQTYNGRAIAPMLTIWVEGALLSGIDRVPEKEGSGFRSRRMAFSNKGIEWVYTERLPLVVSLKNNAIVPQKSPRTATEETFSPQLPEKDLQANVLSVEKVATDRVPLTEAEVVVSAGRGLKGPENWRIVEELAQALGAATACSKPVADVGWRPHHEHVGQTGIQISPNLYIAIGISGAIQHLAGVASSKNIVVINNDPEAPFFKAADYGIVGDAFEVVPRLTEAIKKYKAQHSH